MQHCIIVLALFLSLTSLPRAHAESAPPPKWMATPVKEMVDRARATTKQVTIADLKKAIDTEADAVILDVREPNEYEVAHIPGSLNLPRGLLEFSIWTLVPDKNKQIFVYCKTGARAALATKQLNELGYTHAVAVDTGGVAWVKAGYPVQTSITDEEIVILPAQRQP
jgi:rhodanese-related sulfurtransferase